MFFNIAYKNVKKSFKDYSIYFLTLTLAVCIFYSFNSIGSQQAFTQMSAGKDEGIKVLSQMISYISVFIAFVLGGLIVYANNFLIKKRNKELGIYMTLGMSKNKISKILVLETLIVGTLSLISGLILGFVASQGLSILVGKMFEIKMTKFAFSISVPAIVKTVLYFGVMFILVMILNTFLISKYKIIDLLRIGRKTEEVKFKNPIVYVITFVLCVIALGLAYKIILSVGLLGEKNQVLTSILLGIIGTFLFFFSLAGFVLYVVKKNKKVYFKKLNIFIVKQINSKVNTHFMSISVVCLMLFLTIGMLSTGFSLKQAIESSIKEVTQYDASFVMYSDENNVEKDIKTALDNVDFKINKGDKAVYYNTYLSNTTIGDAIPIKLKDYMRERNIFYLKLSDYNKMRELNNQKPVDLKENELLVTTTSQNTASVIEQFIEKNSTIKIDDKTYSINNKEVIKDNLKTFFISDNTMTVIVNDKICDNKPIAETNIDINFAKNNIEKSEKYYKDKAESYTKIAEASDTKPYIQLVTKNEILELNRGMSTTILFIGIYIGIVFLISSMAVLALQQLSEASDSIDRYISLKKLGASTKDINKTIFAQTLIFFSMPIGLALVHSVVGIKVASDFVAMYNKPDIGTASLLTGGTMLVVYTIYFYVTYSGYKNIVKNNI